MKHIKYPKTPQFRQFISDMKRSHSFSGVDENGDPVYDHSKTLPTITINGTVKLHGTNASITFNPTDGLYAQSKNNIITIGNDNAGFAFFVDSNKEDLQKLVDEVIEEFDIHTPEETITIYGEWAGKGVQSGVAISQLEKSFYIFGIKVSNIETGKAFWLDYPEQVSDNPRIFNINEFPTYTIDIDLNRPELVQNKLEELTIAVEDECPVAKHFGVSGIGEGIVWCLSNGDERKIFKVKGAKHSVTKVKTLAKVDIEVLNSIHEFVDYAVTEQRCEQALGEVFGENEIDIKKMGDYIRWIVKDITVEEADTLVENKLEPKQVNKYISTKARQYFMKKYNTL